MRRILFILLCLFAVEARAQVQGEGFAAGSNLSGQACRVNENQTALATEGEANFCSVDTKGNQLVSLNAGTAAAANPVKLEDSVHVTGDAGIPSWGVANPDVGGALCSGNSDYCPLAVNLNGALYTHLAVSNNAISAVRSEDQAHTSGDAAVPVMGVIRSALVAPAAANDYTNIQLDESGRTITTMSPAGEIFTNCSASATGVVDVAIKAAVASNRSYITSITCSNTAAAVSTEVEIRDGTTVMDVGYVASTTLGESQWTKSYPVPLRGSVNTAVNVRPVTTSSATRCCAQGYISVN